MKDSKSPRINGFDQIKAFYSWVFNNVDKRITPQHISLYLFLINQNNRNNWVEWFKCPYDLAMQGACIGNKKTYYSCLNDLVKWNLIQYSKGANEWKSPLIKLEVLNRTSSDTSTVPQSVPLPTPLPTHIYKLITDNLQLITIHFAEIAKFIEALKRKDRKPKEDWTFIDRIINIFIEEHGSYQVMNEGMERKMAAKILSTYKSKYPHATSEETLDGLRYYFKRCINIEDGWLHDNMSLTTIVSKFNSINKILNHGKSKNNGVTTHQLANLVATKIGIDANE
jgi:hypothetical protein